MDLYLLNLAATSTLTPSSGLVSLAETQIETYLIQGNFFIVAAAIAVLPILLERISPLQKVVNNQWIVRFMPLIQIGLSIGAVMLPGALLLPDHRMGTLLIACIWTSALAMMGQKLIGHMLLGDDPRILTLAVESPGQSTPVQTSMPPPLPPADGDK